MEYTRAYASPLGVITLAADGERITGLWFEGQAHYAETLDPLHDKGDLAVFGLAERWLDLYFSGRAPDFTPPLRMKTTAFHKAVWEILLSVPWGGTITYGEIARRIADRTGASRVSARAVGGAVARNAISLIIPCHRVVGADGSLTGYAGGLHRKAWLLDMEKAAPDGSCPPRDRP